MEWNNKFAHSIKYQLQSIAIYMTYTQIACFFCLLLTLARVGFEWGRGQFFAHLMKITENKICFTIKSSFLCARCEFHSLSPSSNKLVINSIKLKKKNLLIIFLLQQVAANDSNDVAINCKYFVSREYKKSKLTFAT